ncbi:MAG: hypothetical protein GQ557_01940 [Mycoplasmataceae bacterium]|nr:hypothetical protein [Mycoplasmataceae bacterium]
MDFFKNLPREVRKIRWSNTRKTLKVFISTIIIIITLVLIVFVFSVSVEALINVL